MNRKVILCIVKNYNYYHMSPFLLSLEKVGYKGDLVFFAGHDMGRSTLAALKKRNVKVIPFRPQFPYIDNPADASITLPEGITIFNYRHFLYHDYLKKNNGKYDAVLLSDVRDVVFQKDPFDFKMEDGLCCFLENDDFSIKSNTCNKEWVIAGFGTDGLDLIGDRLISCAGVTYGTFQAMIEYLEKMVYHVRNVYDPVKCIDQGIHNYLIYSNSLSKVKLYGNNDGPVQTMALMNNITYNHTGEVINSKGNVVNVLHQYDRHKELNDLISRKLFGSKFNMLKNKIYYKIVDRLF